MKACRSQQRQRDLPPLGVRKPLAVIEKPEIAPAPQLAMIDEEVPAAAAALGTGEPWSESEGSPDEDQLDLGRGRRALECDSDRDLFFLDEHWPFIDRPRLTEKKPRAGLDRDSYPIKARSAEGVFHCNAVC